MTKASRKAARRARAQRSKNLPVYVIAGGLLLVVGLLLYNIFNQPREPGTLTWSEPPAMQIDPSRRYEATIVTAKGDIVIELLPQAAPLTVNNFVFLAREGYYDGVTFHRVLPGFVAQGGDPTGTGGGGPGYFIPNETSPDLTFDSAGVVAMANSGADRNGSQFFITYAPQPSLNGGYTIFGRVTAGMDVAEAITPRDPDENPTFTGDVIETITISEL
jgi:cyclophilin family peptidyl-prolyl cis-trans isomerase